MINSTTLLFFSPTGSTRRIVTLIGSCLSSSVTQCNLLKGTTEKRTFTPNDLVIVGIPVYGGRVPGLALKALSRYSGKGTPVVSVAVFGNRAYEDALLELNDQLKANGFRVLASAAFVAEHSIVNSIGHDRPDDEDRAEIEQFASKIRDKYLKHKTGEWDEVTTPGNKPYKEYSPASIAPYSDENCVRCKICISECPVNAITAEGTDADKCILCMRCVSTCPRNARKLPDEYVAKVKEYLEGICPGRSANEVFI